MMFTALIHGVFVLLCVAVAWLFATSKTSLASSNAEFDSFQRKYLRVYFCVMMADWLQGPYLYRLYEEYGYLEEQIAALYIVGFMSAMLSGPLLGGLADRHGRKRMCQAFCLLYSTSCLCKLHSGFFVLMLGRVLGGISTSLLFSTFESWMIAEHNRQGFPTEWLPRTFAIGTFGNGVIAALAGVLANVVADCCGHHPVRPFVTAIGFLLLGGLLIRSSWDENKPSEGEALANRASRRCSGSLKPIFTDRAVLLLGAVQAGFESAMYIFVFLWTPALDPPDEWHPPLGFIFGTFMLSLMMGSSIFKRQTEAGWPVTRVLRVALVVATVCLAVSAISSSPELLFVAFVCFEAACGVFFPAMGSLRGKILPESNRAAIIGWFRVPLNLIVVLFLFCIRLVSRQHLFAGCFLLVLGSTVAHQSLARLLAQRLSDEERQEKGQAGVAAALAKKTAAATAKPAPAAAVGAAPGAGAGAAKPAVPA